MTSTPFTLIEWPPWAQMWALALAIYIACKWLTWDIAATRAPIWKHAVYLAAWPGMDAARFLGAPTGPDCAACRPAEWLAAAGKLALGIALLFGVTRLIPPQSDYLAGWIGMIAIVLILHFGVFHLLSCGWRRIGIPARALMHRPLASASLSEFWSRRWNTAFRDLTHRTLFRASARWFGPQDGIVAGFLFSGAVHDLVLSVPARGGYGGPTAFFAIQGAAMVFERSALGHRMGLGSGWTGRWFALLVIVAPLGLLLHRPFVIEVVTPFMRAIGAR